jgi:hypothetical protein
LYIRQFIGISYFTPLSPLYKGEKQENPVLFIKGRNKKIQFSLYRGETRKSSSLPLARGGLGWGQKYLIYQL